MSPSHPTAPIARHALCSASHCTRSGVLRPCAVRVGWWARPGTAMAQRISGLAVAVLSLSTHARPPAATTPHTQRTRLLLHLVRH